MKRLILVRLLKIHKPSVRTHVGTRVWAFIVGTIFVSPYLQANRLAATEYRIFYAVLLRLLEDSSLV
jgi:hypothetical protein